MNATRDHTAVCTALAHSYGPGVLLGLGIFLVYLPALQAGFVWTEFTWVINNPTLVDLNGLVRIWTEPGATVQYYPLMFTSLWLDYHLFGTEPFGFHLVNVVLHVCNVVVLWRLLRKLRLPGAWLAAAIWGIHPVNAETVVWLMERSNLLTVFFCLSTLHAWLRYDPGLVDGTPTPRNVFWYVVSLLCFVCALLCKTHAVVLPAVILVLSWWRYGSLDRSTVNRAIPMFFLSASFAAITIWVEKGLIGEEGVVWSLNYAERVLIAGRAFWFYLAKLVLPYKLTLIYPTWQADLAVWWQYLYPLMTIVLFAAVWINRSAIGRAPVAALLYFGIALSPVVGFVAIYFMRYSIYVTDHWQYIPSIGPITLAVSACVKLLSGKFLVKGVPAPSLLIIVLLLFAPMTWNQARIYENEDVLWRDVIDKNPSAWLAHNNLGVYLAAQGRSEEALAHWHSALAIVPNRVEMRVNIGETLLSHGKFKDALQYFMQAFALNPNHQRIRTKIGIALSAIGKTGDAIEYYQEQLERDADDPVALNNLAWIRATHRDAKYRDARAAVQLAEQARASFGEEYIVLDTLAAAYAEAGEYDKAVDVAQLALEVSRKTGNSRFENEAKDHLRLYLDGRPVRE